jgi:hypothetical protein
MVSTKRAYSRLDIFYTSVHDNWGPVCWAAAVVKSQDWTEMLSRRCKVPLSARQVGRVPLWSFSKHPQTLINKRSFSALNYVEEMRSAWKKDPFSVHASWNDFFKKQEKEPNISSAPMDHADPDVVQRVASEHIRMLLLVRSFQVPTPKC